MAEPEILANFVGGRWVPSSATAHVDVYNPARDSGRTFKAWIRAGGKTRSGQKVKMRHR